MSDFIAFARAHGVLIDRLQADGRIHRCPTSAHERKKNGAYSYDGRRGWVFGWDLEGETHWFNDENAKPWTDAEKTQWARRQQVAKQRQEEGHKRAAERAQAMLEASEWAPSSYLSFKGFRERLGRHTAPEWRHGYGHIHDGALVIPMRSWIGNLRGAQVVRWNAETRQHEKKMLPGMKAKGAVFRLGPATAPTTVLCEGYCTGLSIKLALEQMRMPWSVLVCFSDSNLVYVAPHVTGRAIVFADNDASGAGERAARATGRPYCMAPDVGTDANDLHVRDGLFAVCAVMRNLKESVAA